MTRPVGRPNQNKDFLLKRLQDMYGDDFHPIMAMAKNACIVQKRIDDGLLTVLDSDLQLAHKYWSEIAKYVEPQLKAVDVDVKSGGETLRDIINISAPDTPN